MLLHVRLGRRKYDLDEIFLGRVLRLIELIFTVLTIFLVQPVLLRLQILGLSLSIVVGEVAILAEALRIVQLRVVLACPGLFRATTAMVAVHAHVLRVVAS